MKRSLLSLFAGTAMLVGVGLAQADETVTLTDSQMDGVTAGNALFTFGNNSVGSAAVNAGGATAFANNSSQFTQATGATAGAGGFQGCGGCTLFLN